MCPRLPQVVTEKRSKKMNKRRKRRQNGDAVEEEEQRQEWRNKEWKDNTTQIDYSRVEIQTDSHQCGVYVMDFMRQLVTAASPSSAIQMVCTEEAMQDLRVTSRNEVVRSSIAQDLLRGVLGFSAKVVAHNYVESFSKSADVKKTTLSFAQGGESSGACISIAALVGDAVTISDSKNADNFAVDKFSTIIDSECVDIINNIREVTKREAGSDVDGHEALEIMSGNLPSTPRCLKASLLKKPLVANEGWAEIWALNGNLLDKSSVEEIVKMLDDVGNMPDTIGCYCIISFRGHYVAVTKSKSGTYKLFESLKFQKKGGVILDATSFEGACLMILYYSSIRLLKLPDQELKAMVEEFPNHIDQRFYQVAFLSGGKFPYGPHMTYRKDTNDEIQIVGTRTPD